MKFFLDFVPSDMFLKNLDIIKLKMKEGEELVLNMYIKQLPSMNINEYMYCDIKECGRYISELKQRKLKINIILDTFCFGNKEFTESGKKIFAFLDTIFKFDIDYITISNNFFFNYVKRRHKNIKVIISEYSEINNVQKISRYIYNLKADAIKLDFKLALDMKKMEYIKNNFDLDDIHIDMNKIYYDNDIYRDSLNNSIAHYIQEKKWDDIRECIKEYENKQINLNSKQLNFNVEKFNQLKRMGYRNFWYYNLNKNGEEYIKELSVKI